MHITLIGMSSIGKSHWARWLAANHGFTLVHCDQLIAKKLESGAINIAGHDTKDLAGWMGQPYDPQYPEASRAYIECEKSVMRDVIEKLKQATPGQFLIIDTTGSVIYTGAAIIDQLKALTKIVYFEASHSHVAELFERDRKNPKPLIWDSMYRPRPGENPEEARRRCFPELLESRMNQYASMAHITMPFAEHKTLDANIDKILGPKA